MEGLIEHRLVPTLGLAVGASIRRVRCRCPIVAAA